MRGRTDEFAIGHRRLDFDDDDDGDGLRRRRRRRLPVTKSIDSREAQ